MKVIFDLLGGMRTEVEVADPETARAMLDKIQNFKKPMIVHGPKGSTLLNPRHVVRAYFVMPGTATP